MKRENKKLLLQDLCARLPYDIRADIIWKYGIVRNKTLVNNVVIQDLFCNEIKSIKPYLRPMSSMTEDEKKSYKIMVDLDMDILEEHLGDAHIIFPAQYNSIDWLNSHHFDYRGLIEKGLAIEAPKEIYK